MDLSKDGKSVTLAREELETLARHLQQLEKVVAQFEKSEAAKAHLPADLQATWAELKKFLDAEDAKAHKAAADPRARKQFCCKLSTAVGGIVRCQTFNARYVFAWIGCVLEALAGGFNAELVSGSCDTASGCR
jgi:exonuclease VII small subunit